MGRSRRQAGGFLQGLILGLSASVAALLLLPLLWPDQGAVIALSDYAAPALSQVWQALDKNLQGSILPFALAVLTYLSQLQKLQTLLSTPEPAIDRVLRHEQLLDLSANLFFGIGVIWTAIGMRDALIHGLGDPVVSSTADAFSVLQRLVDGGILLALSTTIVGGVGGYLMRVVKSVVLGKALATLYLRESQQPAAESLAALQHIEQLLQQRGVEREAP
ncbi:MAG: hypothetical protein ABJ308_01240 [Halieaceae bacterium]